jgi:hypothetical protein
MSTRHIFEGIGFCLLVFFCFAAAAVHINQYKPPVCPRGYFLMRTHDLCIKADVIARPVYEK